MGFGDVKLEGRTAKPRGFRMTKLVVRRGCISYTILSGFEGTWKGYYASLLRNLKVREAIQRLEKEEQALEQSIASASNGHERRSLRAQLDAVRSHLKSLRDFEQHGFPRASRKCRRKSYMAVYDVSNVPQMYNTIIEKCKRIWGDEYTGLYRCRRSYALVLYGERMYLATPDRVPELISRVEKPELRLKVASALKDVVGEQEFERMLVEATLQGLI